MDKDEVVNIILGMVRASGSQASVAKTLGVPRQHIHIALKGVVRPNVLKALGLEQIEAYRQINSKTARPMFCDQSPRS